MTMNAESLNFKTKLVFLLPTHAAGKFKLVLHHTESEADLDRVRLTVDRKEVSLRGESEEGLPLASIRHVAEQDWLVEVDAKEVITRGRVEVSIA